MTLALEQLLSEAEAGRLRPVYLLVGAEQFLRRKALAALHRAAVGSDEAGFNEERFTAGEVDASAVVSAAKTLPMFAPRRFVSVSGVERWEGQKERASRSAVVSPLDRLADYVAAPAETTTLVLIADKLDSRRRLVLAAKKGGFLVVCDPLAGPAVVRWAQRQAEVLGHSISTAAAELLCELAGSDLSVVADALERVSLYVGRGQPLSEEAIGACVANLRVTTVWELVGAVGRRDAAGALRALDGVFEPGSGPRLVGLLCWSARQLIRFGSAIRAGASAAEAAKRAGVPPFKVRELEEQLRAMPLPRAERWLEKLAEVDLALKGGSRLPARLVVERALIDVCR